MLLMWLGMEEPLVLLPLQALCQAEAEVAIHLSHHAIPLPTTPTSCCWLNSIPCCCCGCRAA